MHTGDGRFGSIDANLTVFALANGVDLIRTDGQRRLEWFAEGLERGVVIEGDGDGFAVRALTWRSSTPDVCAQRDVADGLSADEIRSTLPDAIEAANALTAPGPEQPAE